MEDSNLQKARKLLEDLTKGVAGSEFEILTSKGLKVITARKGFFLCHFVVPDGLLDQNGNWQAGAIATMIDNLGAVAVYSLGGPPKVSVDFSVSYFSTAKFQEEVEIEAKAVKEDGKLMAHVVEIRRKSGGELIAIGRQWMASPGQSESSSSKL
ncbi:hypothetical protein TIFTF001_006624 [Ficus carica]|uniref:Acyl-coenzyme A thioesterase 13 n=1 Tax=Ficus carica TaxID=3494 RepID=A0AA87ZNF7_FICCA|nr:hypothetical protein TIFTF001_006624 [Ficus carica]